MVWGYETLQIANASLVLQALTPLPVAQTSGLAGVAGSGVTAHVNLPLLSPRLPFLYSRYVCWQFLHLHLLSGPT